VPGTHEDDHPLVARPVVRVRVHTEVLLGHRADELEVGVLFDAVDDAPDLQVPEVVLGIDDGEGYVRISLQVAQLLARPGLAELDVLPVPVEPDRVVVRLAVGPDGRDVRYGVALQKILETFGDNRSLASSRQRATSISSSAR
jgi:hypothetical protein